MAISVAASTISLVNARESCKPSARFFKRPSISTIRFAGHLGGFQMGSGKTRYVPLAVSAKKQTYSSFDDLLANSPKPVLVDFYATWCGPCQHMVSILNEVSNNLSDVIQVVKIDTEKYPSIANKYSVAALPTFILFKDGQPCNRFEGTMSVNQLIGWVEESLKVKRS